MRPYSDYTIEALFQLLARDSEPALEAIAERCKPALLKRIGRITRNAAWTEEVWNDCMQALWEHRAAADSVLQPMAWLYAIARNKAINKIRYEKTKGTERMEEWMEWPSNTDIEKEAGLKVLKEQINKAVASLPAQEQKVFRLKVEEGLKRREIAELMNLSEHTVKNHFRNACEALRKQLGKLMNSIFI